MKLVHVRAPVFALCLGTALCTGGVAHAAATGWVGNNHAAVRLLTSTDDIAGATLNAGLEFRFAKGWHGYWRTPGDAGVSPQIDWSRSDNVAGAEVAWPAPHRLVIEGLQNYIYEGKVVLPIKLRIKNPTATTRIEVGLNYAACSDVCVPYQANLTLPLSPGAGTPAAEAPLIDQAKTSVPGTPQAVQIDVVRAVIGGKGSAHTLTVDLRSVKPFVRPDLFVEGARNVIPAAPAVALRDNRRSAHLTVALAGSLPADHPLTVTFVDQDRSAQFSTTANSAGAAPAGLGTLAALLSALLGGLILNLMPCVLPVLSIKLFAFTRHASEGLRVIRLGALATAGGITFSFLLIALSLVILKWSGATLGWGIQFQQPWFLAGMATVTVLFAASFFELLPIALPSSILRFVPGRTTHHFTFEAFLTGSFATLLATPCSAPFVGTAVGFALTRGPLDILAIFLCLGIGMSLPYLIAALFPGSVRWLPRPGRWMILLRQVLGVLLLGTAIWLLFILWSTAGAFVAATTGILLAALIGFRALLRVREGSILSRGSRAATAILALAPLVVSVSAASPTFQTSTEPRWQSFDPAALQRAVGEGKTVLVDVTATWCLTCKVNELTVFEANDVRARLDQPDVVRMRADWTRPDPAIAMYLRHFARFGIPLDVVYGPRQPQGKPLPELLTPGILIRALDHAAATSSAEAHLH
jgi:suppressor for copper-sensitivity B